jgi:hypothetical protein
MFNINSAMNKDTGAYAILLAPGRVTAAIGNSDENPHSEYILRRTFYQSASKTEFIPAKFIISKRNHGAAKRCCTMIGSMENFRLIKMA